MRRVLQVEPADPVPIWKQIEDGMRRLVAAGSLSPGEAVPSVRELARELRVNPATVVKAYQRLVDAGLLVVRRGEGTFVAEHVDDGERRAILDDGARRYVVLARELAFNEAEAIEAVRRVLAGNAVEVGR